jgi:mannitol-specific phosphotransferase system IIBC component
MAVAVIGGLITSTFLSLLVIPAVFTFVAWNSLTGLFMPRWSNEGIGVLLI